MKKDKDNFDVEDLIEEKFRDVRLERRIIAYLIRRNHIYSTSMFHEMFTVEIYQHMFHCIKEKNTKRMPRDILKKLVYTKITDEQYEIADTYIGKIYKTNLKGLDKNNFKLLIDDIKNAYESREILKKVGRIVNSTNNFDLQKTKEILRETLLINAAYDHFSSGDFVGDYEERVSVIKKYQENPDLLGIKTGIKKFDKISGGIMEGELAILVAPTGKGKSMALGNIGMNAYLSNKNVIYVSLEMTKHQLQFRLDSRIAMVEHKKFRQATLSKKDFRKWDERMNKLKLKRKNYYETMCLPRGANVKQIEEESTKIQSKYGKKVDIILVDYLNLMSPNKFKGSIMGWENQSEIAYNLKGLCMDFNGTGIPVWAANQLTDEHKPGKKIETRHMKYARGISEVAQIICGLNQTVDQFLEDGRMTFEIVKCRDFSKDEVGEIEIYPKLDFMILDSEKVTLADLNLK